MAVPGWLIHIKDTAFQHSYRYAQEVVMAKKFPIIPVHPERICWGCDKYCPSDSLACGNGSERTQHPSELFGDDWLDWQPPVPLQAEREDDAGAASAMTA